MGPWSTGTTFPEHSWGASGHWQPGEQALNLQTRGGALGKKVPAWGPWIRWRPSDWGTWERGRRCTPQNKTKDTAEAVRAPWAGGRVPAGESRECREGLIPHLTPEAVPAEVATDRDQALFSGCPDSGVITDGQLTPTPSRPHTLQNSPDRHSDQPQGPALGPPPMLPHVGSTNLALTRSYRRGA